MYIDVHIYHCISKDHMQCTYIDLLIHQPLSKTKHIEKVKLWYKLERNEYVQINNQAT